MNEKEKMISGLIYDPSDKELLELRQKRIYSVRSIMIVSKQT